MLFAQAVGAGFVRKIDNLQKALINPFFTKLRCCARFKFKQRSNLMCSNNLELIKEF